MTLSAKRKKSDIGNRKTEAKNTTKTKTGMCTLTTKHKKKIEELEEAQEAIDEEDEEQKDVYDALQEQIDALQDAHYNEVFQYFIIDSNGAEILKDYTNEIVWYNEELDLHVWGITHYGTSWDCVLTDIRCNAGNDEE